MAYDWHNLFVSCQYCNQKFKANFFPVAGTRARCHHDDLTAEAPLLLHPEDDDPDASLRYREHVLQALSDRGRATIEGLGLNDQLLREHRRGSWEVTALLLRALPELDDANPALADEVREHLVNQRQPAAEYSRMHRQQQRDAGL